MNRQDWEDHADEMCRGYSAADIVKNDRETMARIDEEARKLAALSRGTVKQATVLLVAVTILEVRGHPIEDEEDGPTEEQCPRCSGDSEFLHGYYRCFRCGFTWDPLPEPGALTDI